MKKRLKNILCIGAVILLLSALFACSDKEKGKKNDGRSIENTSGGIVKNNGNPVFDSSEYEKVLSVYRKELAECMEIYAEDIEKLKKTKAEDNCKITFDECVFVDFPEINELEVLEFKKDYISVDDSISMFENTLKRTGLYDKIDINMELKDASGQFPNETVINESTGEPELDKNGDVITDYPLVLTDKDRFESGRGFFINNAMFHLQMGNSGAYSYSDGVINANKKRATVYSFFDISPSNEETLIKEGTLNELKDESYPLLDGKISVGEAAEMTETFLDNGTPFPPAEGVTFEIYKAEIYKFNSEIYRYVFDFRRKYKNIPLFTGEGGHKRINDIHIDDTGKMASTISGRTVNTYIGYSEHEGFNSLYTDTKMLSVYDAYLELKAKIGNNLDFKVKKVELVYVVTEAYENKGNSANVIRPRVIYPCWSFTGNYTEGELRAFIDVFTGDIYYYIQMN
ncbi:MAG: hypothetical protein IKR27_08155 [Lachnospiraceae bacterium]|nr:hypothetical protein [Lachnospiraceae bacterium]